MTVKIENKIKNLVSSQTLKAANNLLRTGIVFSYHDKKATITVVKDGDNILHRVRIKDVDSFIASHAKVGFTPQDVAALFHFEMYQTPKAVKNRANKLVVPKLLEEDKSPHSARLLIQSSKSFPNASSTWEACSISVEILYEGRYYIGNANKLRQLRFDETKTGSLKFTDFSPQDRQIIRFLSQHAEPDGAGFSLRADLMAEFLHCLHDYQDFYFGKEEIIIHKDIGELVAVPTDSEKNKLIPALVIGNRIMALTNFNIVIGKGGTWVGILGEYWWAPATIDIMWLRKFLLSGHLIFDPDSDLKKYPIKIIVEDVPQFKKRRCEPAYYLNFTKANELNLSIEYNYGDISLPATNERIVRDSASFWERDKAVESATENELLRLGFKPFVENNTVRYALNDSESIGLFLDKIYTSWLEDSRKIYILPNTLSAYNKINPLTLSCSNPTKTKKFYRFHYQLSAGNGQVSWKQLVKHVREKRQYILTNNKEFAWISEDLSRFVSNFDHIAQTVKARLNVLQIPKATIIYWVRAGKNFMKEIPSNWKNIDKVYESKEKLPPEALLEPSLFRGNLRNYQKVAVNWMETMISNNFNVILADEMGLGKTVQALAFIVKYLQKTSENLPSMVVCPTSLVENWHAEAQKFTPGVKALLVHGKDREGLLMRINDFDLIITSYALIKRDIRKYAKYKFDLLILDEAQHIKNPATINAKVCKSIKSKHRMVLTGTPLENSPEDVWSVFDFLNPGMLGSRERFKASYTKIEYNNEKQKELADKIAPFILRRHKNKVEQLPKKIEQTLYCDLLDSQRELYNSILREGKTRFQSFFDGKTTRFDVLTSLLRLRQLCCHPNLLPDTLRHEVKESAKTELLKELLLETIDSGQRTLVFSQFTSLLKILKGWLDQNAILYEYLDGSTKNRLERVNNFNKNKEISLFLLSLKAGGTGLNLTGADTVIIYDPWWNPAVEAQATDRTHRIGQTKQITSIKLVVKNSIEEKILNLQQEKQGLFDGIIENAATFKKLTDKDIAYLLKG